MQALTEEELMAVLVQPRNALIRQYAKMFRMSDAQLHVTTSAIRAIAAAARSKGTGARGLRSIMEHLLQPTMFEVGCGRAELVWRTCCAIKKQTMYAYQTRKLSGVLKSDSTLAHCN